MMPVWLYKFIPRGHIRPPVLRLEDHLAHLPDRPPASGAFRHIIGDLPCLRDGVGHGNGKPDPPEKRDIDHVIADIGRLFRSKSPPLQDFGKDLRLVPDRPDEPR